ncbi:protein lethal(3)malignant blood neoplasm 1-like [Harmonia axyridis]|uniref:protein lethal(3)malignant blood neoplasm 1-like n=1 Tax=Harmonia axyridis TaxID=115357 RepID=UPI001E275461|nr:protein lethal(3)malignant blood neoplasm 1-like [Harmonia axyridis]
MYAFTCLVVFVGIFSVSNSLIGLESGGASAGGSVKVGGRFGLGGLGKIGGSAGGLIGGAEGVLGGAGSKIGGLLQNKQQINDGLFGSSDESSSSSSSSSSEEHNKRGKKNKGKKGKGKKNGRGIDKHSGIGSHNGIATPVLNLLGLTKTVCHISYAGEAAIEKLGNFAIGMNYEVRKLDHAIANYVTDNIILKAVDTIRKGHNDVVKFIVGTHVAFTKFATNTIIEVYRTTKSPIRELLAC